MTTKTKAMRSIHFVYGFIDDCAPDRPFIARPFTVSPWFVLLILFLTNPAPALYRVRRWGWNLGQKAGDWMEQAVVGLMGRVLMPAPVFVLG